MSFYGPALARVQAEALSPSTLEALPFLTEPDDLLALACDHRDAGVRPEGAWAAAKLDREAGWKRLRGFAADPRFSATAVAYLEELGRPDLVPDLARDPDFVARSEMARWLAHPQEFGRPPDGLRLYDSRVLHWPPTDDRRPVWLFEYRYDPDPDEEDGQPDIGLGMVGGVTFALFGETTGGAGRALLREDNPDGGF